jgi:hypothetical protein
MQPGRIANFGFSLSPEFYVASYAPIGLEKKLKARLSAGNKTDSRLSND